MLLPKCVCLRGSAPDPAGGLTALPACKRWVSPLQRATQNCGPQGPETPRSATASKSHLYDLAEQLCDGDTLALANNIRYSKKSPLTYNRYYQLQLQLTTMCQTNLSLGVTDCEQKLSKLCVHKAMGPDNIPNWILKDFYILAAPIAAIFNSSVRQSYVPPSWKQAEILPIPKVTQVTSLARHLCPIALTPVLSKVLESFVVSWMRGATVHSETPYGGIKIQLHHPCTHHDVTPCASNHA